MTTDLTFQEQIDGVINDCQEKYPDVIKWIHQMSEIQDFSLIQTDMEDFLEQLTMPFGKSFHGHPYIPKSLPGGGNMVPLIKWYRNKHGVGLKEAKDACDQFRAKHYPQDTIRSY